MSYIGPSAGALRNALTNTQKGIVVCWWSASAVAAAQTNVNMNYVFLLNAGRYVFPSDGLLVGFSRESDAAVTAGNLTIFGLRDGAQVDSVGISSGQRGRHTFTTPIAISGGQAINFQYTTDAGYVGPATIIVAPLVVFNV